MTKCLIIGQGSIGQAVTNELARHCSVVGVSRTPKIYDDVHKNITHWQMDALDLTDNDLQGFTHIAIIITPSDDVSDKVQAYQGSYLAICQHLAGMMEKLPNLRQILFVSSTAVYGENDGQVVNEYSPANPASPTARILLDAENILVQAFGDKAVIVRPSGIYGESRQYMIRLAKSAHTDGVANKHYTNRIMDMDLVAVLVQILLSDKPKSLYLATDFCPATSLDVMTFICDELQIIPPKVIKEPPTGKIVMSNLPKNWLRFTCYQQGYAWIVKRL